MANKKFWLYYNYAHVTPSFRVEEFGFQEAEPSYSFTETRKAAVLHCILDGECDIRIDDAPEKVYHLQKGQAIILRKGVRYQCDADAHMPCSRFWLALDGEDVDEALNRIENETVTIISGVDVVQIDTTAKQLYRALRSSADISFFVLSRACLLLDGLNKAVVRDGNVGRYSNTDKQRLIYEVKRYIDEHFTEKVTVRELAYTFGYERSYLYRLFMEQSGSSPQQYIVAKRIQKAKELLSETDMPISKIANQVGYDSYASFTKIFLKETGEKPGIFRGKQ